MTPRVYIAGPHVFFPNQVDVEASYREAANRYGLQAVLPADTSALASKLPQISHLPTHIKRVNIELIRSSGGVIADCRPWRGMHMDPGTAYEIGYAEAIGLLVFRWSNDLRPLIDRIAAKARLEGSYISDRPTYVSDRPTYEGCFVENFGLAENLMILSRPEQMYASFEDAAIACAVSLKA